MHVSMFRFLRLVQYQIRRQIESDVDFMSRSRWTFEFIMESYAKAMQEHGLVVLPTTVGTTYPGTDSKFYIGRAS